MGARDPDEAAARVHEEREGLWGSAKAERDGVATIAVREERGFDFGVRRVFVGGFEVVSSGYGGGSEVVKCLIWVWELGFG